MKTRAAVAFKARQPLGRDRRGTAFGGVKGRTDVPRIVDGYMDGRIAIDPMITYILSLDEIDHGFDLMHARESIRSVVLFEERKSHDQPRHARIERHGSVEALLRCRIARPGF